MRISPLLPIRRPAFGRRVEPVQSAALDGPNDEERRLIDRIMRHAGQRPR